MFLVIWECYKWKRIQYCPPFYPLIFNLIFFLDHSIPLDFRAMQAVVQQLDLVIIPYLMQLDYVVSAVLIWLFLHKKCCWCDILIFSLLNMNFKSQVNLIHRKQVFNIYPGRFIMCWVAKMKCVYRLLLWEQLPIENVVALKKKIGECSIKFVTFVFRSIMLILLQ